MKQCALNGLTHQYTVCLINIVHVSFVIHVIRQSDNVVLLQSRLSLQYDGELIIIILHYYSHWPRCLYYFYVMQLLRALLISYEVEGRLLEKII